MSSPTAFNNVGAGKKAVHVKWAGKTIALGTFSSAEADEKCARAKALTRAWRSTMRPKPSREWVMLELERLQVRVVSGRLGRKGEGEDDEMDGDEGGGMPGKSADATKGGTSGNMSLGMGNGMPQGVDPALLRRDSLLSGRDPFLGSRRDSITGLLSAADMAGANRNHSLGFNTDSLGDLMQRRSSSIGMSLLSDTDANRRNSSMNLSAVLDHGSDMPPHRPLVGGGSAAAYEAARADHYNNLANKRPGDQERRASGLGLGGGMGGGGAMGMSVNPNQHYEMLKLHHMNLLNEIQETTLMMNLYQQQQLQQQQLQQQAEGSGPSNADMAMLLQHQQNGVGGLMGSMGLGMGNASNDMQALLRQQQQMMQGNASSGHDSKANVNLICETKHDQGEEVDARRRELNEQIARLQREAQQLQKGNEASSSTSKRETSGKNDRSAKRVKAEKSSA